MLPHFCPLQIVVNYGFFSCISLDNLRLISNASYSATLLKALNLNLTMQLLMAFWAN